MKNISKKIIASALIIIAGFILPEIASACSGTYYVEVSNAENFLNQAIANCPAGSSFTIYWL